MKVIAMLMCAVCFTGCAIESKRNAADIGMPARWRHEAAVSSPRTPVDDAWWRSFGNAELNQLVEQASANSFEIAAAAARVDAARATAQIAGAQGSAHVNASADASRQNGLKSFDAGLAARYEIDFWGRIRAQRQAALDNLDAASFDRDTVRLTVSADVANRWLESVSLRERVRIAGDNLDATERLLETMQARERAGAATRLELAQQATLAAVQRRALTSLRQQADDSAAMLAALLAMPPSALTFETASLDTVIAPSIDAGVPSELLARRPDIASAEARLAAASANVSAARAAMLPRITLTGSAGYQGERMSRLFDAPLYNLAAGLVAPIFDGGTLAGNRDLAIAQKEELLANYRQSIVDAFADVERALNANSGAQRQLDEHAVELAQAEQTLNLAQARYRAGSETFLTVLDAERSLATARDTDAQLRLARIESAVGLYRALGGGWRISDSPASSETPAPARNQTG
jgi:outer membrane protein, multidrug efflux system